MATTKVLRVLAVGSWLLGSWCCTHPSRGSSTIPARPAPTRVTTTNESKSGDTEIAVKVMAAERTAWEQERAEAWIALFAPDAVIVTGRGPTPDPFDVHFGKREFAELLTYEFSGHAFEERAGPFRMQLQHVGVRTEWHGDNLSLELIRVIDHDDFYQDKERLLEERLQEQYTLQRSRGAWQIVTLRAWPLSFHQRDSSLRSFDEKGLAQTDARIAALPDTQLREKGKACFEALRYADSADWYEKAANSPKGEARDWLLLGWSAAFAGQMERARKAFAEGMRRDPTLPVPTTRPAP